MPTNDRESAMEAMLSPGQSQLDCALAKIKQILFDGLRHGFFEFTVSGEAIKQGKRRVLIKAGNSHSFVVPAEELKTHRE